MLKRNRAQCEGMRVQRPLINDSVIHTERARLCRGTHGQKRAQCEGMRVRRPPIRDRERARLCWGTHGQRYSAGITVLTTLLLTGDT